MKQALGQPRGWCQARLPDIADINPRGLARAPREDERISFVPMPAVEAMTGRLDTSRLRPWREVRKGYTRFQEGDVLFAKITPCMENGKVAVARKLAGGIGVGSTEFHVVRPAPELLADFVRFFLLRDQFRKDARARMTGTAGQLRVPTSFLEETVLPLAPPAEQHRLVEALESYFTRLDDVEATLERVKHNLERYRASVLQAAVEGRLVTTAAEAARLEGRPFESAESLLSRTTRKSPIRASDDGSGNLLNALPAGWCWTALESMLAEPLVNGRSVQTAEVGFPVLRLTALKNGTIDLAERKFGAWTAGEAAGCLVTRDDFFVARGNGSIRLVGRGGLVREEPDPVAFPDTFIRIRARGDVVNLRFLSYVWNSRIVRRYVERRAKTTAGIHKVNQADLAATPFPLPPREEQDRIVEVLDRAFSIVQFLHRQVERGSCSCARLRQAALSWAFQGRLVDQDPADEPASVLLDRIRAERTKAASSPETPRRRGRPRKAVKK